MASFFGLTALNPTGDAFRASRANVLERMRDVPLDVYLDAFDAFTLAKLYPILAWQIRVNGEAFMKRQELPDLLKTVLGGAPKREELDAFLTFFDVTASGLIDRREYARGVEALLERCAAPAAQTHYVSAEKLRADREKFKRLPDKPQHGYAKPLLSSQVFGWHCEQARAVSAGDGGTAALGVTKKFFPVTKTDVTLKEGRSLADYYGEDVVS